jgi:hypothetical protein
MLFFILIMAIILTIGTNEVNKRKAIIKRLRDKQHGKEEKKSNQESKIWQGYSEIYDNR